MSATTTLRTERLLLRPFVATDADDVQRLADDLEIARNTLSVPHPYPEGHAASWIESLEADIAEGRSVVFAVCDVAGGRLLGAIGLHIDRKHERAEMGFWIGRPGRGQGYATEAGQALLDHGFTALGLGRIHASHFPWNPASGRVMAKLGMRLEGTLRGHFLKDGERVDSIVYGILREEHAGLGRGEGR